MKRYWIAAGTLLLSTSALAVAADTKDMATNATDAQATAEAKAFAADWDKALIDSKAEADVSHQAKFETASLDKPIIDELATGDGTGKVDTASADSFDKPAAMEHEAKFQTASADAFDKPLATEASAKLAMASFDESQKPFAADISAKVQTAAVEPTGKPDGEFTGMGGPLDDKAGATALDLAPQPAAQNYPPCSPGPGDDRCIQLYEPGVRAELASWNRPTGGLLDGDHATAMGGPYGPVQTTGTKPAEADLASVYKPETAAMGGPFEAADEDVAKPAEADLASVYKADNHAAVGGPYEPVDDDLAMNGDGTIDAFAGEITDSATGTQLASHDEFAGVGGPIEAQSGYPPCSPGPGDDRCIQLYEAGVNGAGN